MINCTETLLPKLTYELWMRVRKKRGHNKEEVWFFIQEIHRKMKITEVNHILTTFTKRCNFYLMVDWPSLMLMRASRAQLNTAFNLDYYDITLYAWNRASKTFLHVTVVPLFRKAVLLACNLQGTFIEA